jgi:hypothetical protein
MANGRLSTKGELRGNARRMSPRQYQLWWAADVYHRLEESLYLSANNRESQPGNSGHYAHRYGIL